MLSMGKGIGRLVVVTEDGRVLMDLVDPVSLIEELDFDPTDDDQKDDSQ